MRDNPEIKQILSSYMDNRNNFRSHVLNRATPTVQAITAFNSMVNAHHMQLFAHLPAFNLAELEALSELVNSRLAHVRMSIHKAN